MRLRLHSSTDAALHVIFDPQVLAAPAPRHPSEPLEIPRGGISRQLQKEDAYEVLGRLLNKRLVLTYNQASDGGLDILVLVNEEPEDELLARSFNAQEGALLKVPSGRLAACGVEYLVPETPLESGDEWACEVPHMGSEKRIPPGNYRCTSFSVHYDKPERERILRAKMDPQQLRLARRPEGLVGAGCLSMTLAAAAVIGLTAMQSRYSNYAGLTLSIVGLLAMWAGFNEHRRPAVREAMRATRDLAPPQLVLMLHSLPEGADLSGLSPGEFGPAETGDWGPANRP